MNRISNVLTLICTFSTLLVLGQNSNTRLQSKINDLKKITDMPYSCEDSIDSPGCGQTYFWSIVTEKKDAVPYLINELIDTTYTSATVALFGGQWTAADIAYNALGEIIKGIPTFDLLCVPFDKAGCGYCTYWKHLRANYKNRLEFKKKVSKWYSTNEKNLIWVESKEVLTCDCSFIHPNGGHYELIK
jgi:hypothetical protein